MKFLINFIKNFVKAKKTEPLIINNTAKPIITKPEEKPIITPAINITVDYKLSEHFTFGDLVATNHRGYVDKNREEGKKYIDMLARLANEILEPIWILTGGLYVSSGYRCLELNRLLGSGDSSQHTKAEAADTQYKMSGLARMGITLKGIFNKIAWSTIKFSQIIYEFDSWIHIALIDEILYPSKKMQRLQSSKQNDGKIIYLPVSHPL